jgi:hypothetical protein
MTNPTFSRSKYRTGRAMFCKKLIMKLKEVINLYHFCGSVSTTKYKWTKVKKSVDLKFIIAISIFAPVHFWANSN